MMLWFESIARGSPVMLLASCSIVNVGYGGWYLSLHMIKNEGDPL